MSSTHHPRPWRALLSTWRVRWNAKHLIGTTSGAGVRRSLICRLLPGWYMVEIQVALSRVQQAGTVVITSRDGRERDYGLNLQAGRVTKRLIHVEQLSHLHLATAGAADSLNVLHFRLARVTRAFAASRMRMKLNVMHPRYRTSSALKRGTIDKRADTAAIGVLWQDYCDVFDGTADIAPYKLWVQRFDILTEQQVGALAGRIATFKKRPLVSVVMPVFNPDLGWLAQAIDSVRNQIYPYWELCIADDASTDPRVVEVLRSYAAVDSRILLHVRPENGHISASSNSALAMATGEWIALLDQDDLLSRDALLCMVTVIDRQPDVRLLYSDEDKIDEEGLRSDPYFKPDWNRDLFYSQNMISHLGVYHAALVREVGGFREGYEGSQDYDLALRCIERIGPQQIHHIPRILYHWRMHAQSTAQGLDAKPYAVLAGARALNDHLGRIGLCAEASVVDGGYRVRYQLHEAPLVTVIIPTHNAVGLLRRCVESIRERTSYPNYEILVIDNRSDDPAALAYLRELARRNNVRVERDARPFNYSAINNDAVRSANGAVVALLNNDVEVINGDWLYEMVSHAMRPDVGAVGAKLLYQDGTIQHAGIILGVHGVAGHAHRFLQRSSLGYCGRAALIQSFSAVTGACLVVRKDLYEKVGGMNEQSLAIACNDVDFCLRLGQAGYRTVWTPYAELYHHESASRGFDDTPEKQARSADEIAFMREHWGHLLVSDPAYNPNLSLDAEDFSAAWPPRALLPEPGAAAA